MSTVQELRAKIAKGEIKPSTGGSNGPKVGEGLFTILVTEAIFGKGESGTLRGMVNCKVLSGGTDAEVGGQFKLYIQTQNQKFLESSIAEWDGILTKLGVDQSKIYDDADDLNEVVNNLMNITNKLAIKGKVKLVIKRKEQVGTDSKGHKRYYNDIQSVVEPEAVAPVTAPVAEVVEEDELPFKGEVPATTAAPAKKKKSWEA